MLALLARSGNLATGTNVNHAFLGGPNLNDLGQTMFSGVLKGLGANGSNNSAIWSEGTGSLALVIRKGGEAPDASANFEFSLFSVFNNAGQIAFQGLLKGPEVNDSNDQSIWAEKGNTLALVAREGSRAPGSNANFSFLSFPVLNDVGQTAFLGRVAGIGVVGSNNSGIWSEQEGSLALLVREGSKAPGTDVNFAEFVSSIRDVAFNNLGQTAFFGRQAGPGVDLSNNSGLWSGGKNSLALVAREGSQAPGTQVNFADLNTSVFSDSSSFPVLNSLGQTAFRGGLIGDGVDVNNDTGIWSDASGELTLVAREGEPCTRH